MYKSILMAVDLDEPASWARALPVSLGLARCFDARLTLCAVVPDAAAELQAEWSAAGYRQMIEIAEAKLINLAVNEDIDVATLVGTGSIPGGIIDAAERTGADLIVLASHKPALKDYLLGANASRVVRTAPCSVFVVRGGRTTPPEGKIGTAG
jgi:nucleotide-binding universal stress UspA family protein